MSDDFETGTGREVPPAAVALVDAHVHLHDCFCVAALLDAAAGNLCAAARRLGLPDQPVGCLMLVESQGVDYFGRLAAGAVSTGAWHLHPTLEPVSIVAHRPSALRLILIAGRQIVSREGLEVLALGTRATFADGEPLRQVIDRVVAQDAMLVLPWGVGKWQGARGRLVDDLLARARDRPLYVGDNGGRLGRAPRPKLFARAERSRVHVLPGSDPLPFADQLTKVAGYGFVAEVDLDEAAPFAALRSHLERLEASPRVFGRLETLPGFIRSQAVMQVQKRLRPRRR